jgi:hypothetical protein
MSNSTKYRLYILIGLARSGKSTIAHKYNNYEISFDESGKIIIPVQTCEPRVVVCGDEFRLALGHRYNSYVEGIVASHVQLAVRALLRNSNVLLDETNTNKNSLIKWLEEDIKAIPVFVNTPASVCKERAINSNQSDLLPIIDRMNINLTQTFGQNLDILGTFNKLRTEAIVRHSFKRIVV